MFVARAALVRWIVQASSSLPLVVCTRRLPLLELNPLAGPFKAPEARDASRE
jgi:hypothetical protein